MILSEVRAIISASVIQAHWTPIRFAKGNLRGYSKSVYIIENSDHPETSQNTSQWLGRLTHKILLEIQMSGAQSCRGYRPRRTVAYNSHYSMYSLRY